jgi:gluconokinase
MKKSEFNIIAVDLGTSSVRAGLVTPSLEVLTQTRIPVSLHTDASGMAEQTAHEIITASLECIEEIFRYAQATGAHQLALCFSNAMGSLVCLDSDYHPIQPALTYMDLRSAKDAEDLLTTYGREFFSQTATPMHACYWLPKFLWLHRTGRIGQNWRYYGSIKDLLVYQLTGQFMTDYSNAVSTGMCDVNTGDWDQRLLDIAGISRTQLPVIRPTTTVLESKSVLPAAHSNFSHNLKIVLGAMDGVLSSLGTGAFKPGQVTTAIGSSGACRMAARSPLTEPEAYGVWSYPLDENIWFRGGAMNNGGLVTKWLADTFSETRKSDQDDYDDLFDLATFVKPGSDGLIFLPYLYGVRAPIYDEHARGVYFGITPIHTRGHLVRAGLEGILFALYSIFERLQKTTPSNQDIWCTGGYIKSDLMLHIQADIFGRPIHVPNTSEGSTIGAAMLAFKALKQIEAYEDLSDLIITERIITPNRTAHQTYQEIYTNFIAIYQQLKPLFNNII